MRRWIHAYLIVAGLLLLAVPAGALIPDTVTIGTDIEWLTAGSSDTATITVQVANSTTGSTQFGGAVVEFAVDDTFGSITPAGTTTDGAGMAAAVFTPATTAGAAPITVTVSYDDEEAVSVQTKTFLQQIDHATPHRIENIWYEPEVTAGGTTEIVVRMVDRYGNPVDNRNTAETVGFAVGSPSGSAALGSAAVGVDAAGNATVTLRVDTLPGENIVLVSPPEPLPDRYLTIRGTANGESCAIEVDVQPGGDPPAAVADGEERFLITYTLLDRFGNPSCGRVLAITTNVSGDGETRVTTNACGRAQISYGPRETPGGVTITATAVDNISVTRSQDLAFISGDPKNLLLSTCPETMPSRDVPGSLPAIIRAKVVDRNGNPVAGEVVEFSIQNIAVDDHFNQIAPPSLSGERATTNAHGIASVEFTPGAFTTEYQAPGYSPAATGTCDVVATWDGIERPVNLTWMNYPYLSVETNVTPETVTVSDTVDVTIRLRGDGWAMKPNPIDVILCVDRAETMVSGYPDHMVTVMEAAPIFIDHMIPGWDRIGLLSFGYNGTASVNPKDSNKELTISKIQDIGIDNHMDDVDATLVYYPGTGDHRNHYAGHATLDVPLPKDSSPATNNFGDVRTGISTLIPGGGNPVRKALYEGITELKGNGRSKALKALVFLIDGDYDWYGDPLARAATNKSDKDPEQFGQRTNNWYPFGLSGGEENMAVYARNSHVRIYTITFSSAVSDNCNETMQTLATGSGGKHYVAQTPSDLADVYRQIAGDLKTEAGVNTAVDIAFESVEVNSAPAPGEQIFDYVPEPGVSTHILNKTGTDVLYDDTINQINDWKGDRQLHFDIGTIRLNQTWEATFRLRVLTEGTIGLFGDGATITFNDHDRVPLPRVYITAFSEENTTMDTRSLNVSNLDCTSPATGLLSLSWNLNYTGTAKAVQEVSCSGDGGCTWISLGTRESSPGVSPMEARFDIRLLPPGEYTVRVYATAPDAPDAWDTCGHILVGDWQKDYIRIQ